MQKAKTPEFGKRMRWVLITLIALLIPASLLLQRSRAQKNAANRPIPDVVQMVGPVSQDKDLRDLPYIPVTPGGPEGPFLMRHPPNETPATGRTIRGPHFSEREMEREEKRTAREEAQRERNLIKEQKRKSPKAPKPLKSDKIARVESTSSRDKSSSTPSAAPQTDSPSANIPSPTQTFAGMTQNLGCGGCLPPDTDGDVGPNHYVQSVNSSIRVHDKSGNVLAGPITYNSFFSAMGTSTPCGSNANQGDGVVFYDHIADRWIVSDFAFSAFPGTSFYQCIGVSKTSDPVSGGYWLYAVQVDPANTNFLGDYPKFGLWPDGYYMSVNMFSNNTTFNGVRVYALDRASMINGGAANTIAFTIQPADLGDQYSLLPATYRTGLAPPVGQPEWFMDINSSAAADTVETQVFVRRFHADFVTPANSFFGSGATHAPDGIITVNGFVDAFTAAGGTQIVPNGTATTTQFVDTLGDKLMYPLVYQNLGGVESIYASHTVNNNLNGTGPTAVRWYQFNMTGNTIPATPAQQQSFNNGGDGLWRWMPSINVDNAGNVAIGYSASSTTVDPGIRYAGRLATDPPSTMAQGEAIMTPGTGHQTNSNTSGGGRWGDYSSMFVDPTDTCTFYHTNEYYSATSAAAWNTRVGSFKFATCVANPLPTPTATPTPTPTPTPGPPPVSAGPITITASAGTVGPTDYATLQAAFAAINAGTHQGAINVWVLGNTVEAAAAVLNASGSGSASYTSVIMVPSGARTITGSLATPLVDLNGADVVTIDGLNSGGNSLTLSNTNTGTTSGTSTIRFINGAQNNTVKNCNIQGSATVGVGTAGGAVLFSTTTGVGNSTNTILSNNIGPAGANLPVKAISAVGTTTNNNTINRDNVIDGNNIFDFFGSGGVSTSGIDIRVGNHNWFIQNNRIYQTAPRTFTTTALRYTGITLVGSSGTSGNAHTIRNNIIGFGAANGTGTTTISGSSNEFRGLDLQTASSGTATSVQGNIISGINQTSSRASTTASSSAFIGIIVGFNSGMFEIGGLSGNFVGSLDGSSTIVVNESSTTASTAPVIAIYDFSLSSGTVSNNNVGAITIQSTGTTVGFRGILVNTSSASTEIINNNTIGGPTAAGAITDTQVGSYAMYGIQTALPAISMTGNIVRNMSGNANAAGIVVASGYVVNVSSTASNSSLISRNTVHSLSNASGAGATAIYSMDLTLPPTANITANVIERNLIHSIVNTSTDNTAQVYGIVQRGSTVAGVPVSAVVKNNMVRLGLDANGNSITSGLQFIGIRDIQGATGGAGTNNVSYYFNSVYIGGTGVASSSSTFAFNGSALTSTRSYVDNIFWNARSNASGAGKNYAVSIAGTAPNPAGLTMNYNDLLATGTGGFVGLFNAADQASLANWQAATGQDANSVSVNPLFVNANGSAATGNIHITGASPVLAMGTPVAGINNDFDNDARDPVPDIGADEIPGAVATVLGVNPATGTYGGTVNLSATLTANAVGVSGKNISFTLNGNGVGSALTNGSGVATLSNVSLAGINAGTYPTGVGASFAGDSGYGASGGSNSLTVNQATTSTTITSDINPSSFGQTVTFTATVSSGGGTPTGTVDFVDTSNANAVICDDVSLSSGQAQCMTSTLAVGSHVITAVYSGDTNFSGSTSGTPVTQQVNAAVTAGQLLISEFRLRGPNPNGAQNEFIEIYNNTNSPITVAATDASAGYGVAASDGVLRCTIPNGTVIPARGHFLCANSVGYSLGGYPGGNAPVVIDSTQSQGRPNGSDLGDSLTALGVPIGGDSGGMINVPTATADATYTTDIPDNAGIALFTSTTTFTLAKRLDAAGSTSEANTLYKEGTGYPALSGVSYAAGIEYAFVRDNCGKGGSIDTFGPCPTGPNPKDTDNNAADFFFVDTNGTPAGAGQRLGAPGPENLSAPIERTSQFAVLLLDATMGSSVSPNRVRDFTSDSANNSTFGTLSLRKRVVNNTGAPITRLRFRIVDLTTFLPGAGVADLRPRTSTLVVVSGINDAATCLASNGVATTPCTVNVQGTTLEQPPSQLNGGGFNSTLSAGTVALGTPIANGASLNLHFLLGIQQTGKFRFFIIVEALP
jgi:Bacterial Ig-like domain (group 3)